MAEKYWTEGGDRGINNSSTKPEPTEKKLSGKHKTRVQILDETDCISHSTNTLGKGMNPIILPPAMGK